MVLDRRESVDVAAASIMLGLTFCWGINQVAIKVSGTGYDPVFLMFARSMLAGFIVFLWCRYRGIALFNSDGTLGAGLLSGVLFGSEFTLIFFGLEYTTAARSVLMVSTMPFWVLIGAHFLLGERMNALKFFGLALAFAGVVVVFSDKLSTPDPTAIIGDAMCLGAGLLWALTTLVIKSTRLTSTGPEKLLLYQLGVSAVMMLPMFAFSGPILRDVSFIATASLLFQAVFVVSFTYLVWFWLMRRYPASGLASFAFLTPVFGVISGGVLLGEPLSMKLFLALGLIAVGLIVVNLPARQRG